MNNLKSNLSTLMLALQALVSHDGKAKRYYGKKSGKTRRGATHKQGKVFKAKQILSMTPAQYRHLHYGVGPAERRRQFLAKEREAQKWISA